MAQRDEAATALYRFTTERPVALIMMVVAVTVFGVISYQRLSLSLMPDISYPSLTVRTEYPGSAPQELETVVSRPIEQALGVVNNLVGISSISKAELSDVVLEFGWDTDMNLAIQDAREQLDRIRFPDEVSRPLILRYDPSLDPIMRLGLYGDSDLYTLRLIAEEELKRELETIPGVAAAKVRGGLEEEIRLELDESQLTTLDLDIASIAQRLNEENVDLAAGELREGETVYLVRTLNEFQDLDEIRSVPILKRDGALVRVRDIGTVVRTHKDREVLTRINGTESVEIEIYKEADANIVQVARAVRERIFGTEAQQVFVKMLAPGAWDRAEQPPAPGSREFVAMTNFITYRLPDGIQLDLLTDQSTFISQAIQEVQQTALIGGALAILVLFVFLRRLLPTLIIAIAIPVSIVATFGPLYLNDVSLNIMSLGGLALGIGMLVDNSIVVLESIFRFREAGDDVRTAAVKGVAQVGGAVIAATLTTIAVFFPLVFVEGVAGQAFGDMSLTVVFSLLASLLVALFLIPMLSSRQFQTPAEGSPLAAGTTVHRFRILEPLLQRPDAGRVTMFALAKAIPGIPLECGVKILLITVSLVWVVLKGAAIVLLTFPAALLHRVPAFIQDNEPERRWRYGARLLIFRGCARFSSHTVFMDRLQALLSWALRGAGYEPVLRWVAFIPAVSYILVYFLLQWMLETTGKILVYAGLAALVLLIAVVALAGVLIYPLILPVLNGFEKVYGALARWYPIVLRVALQQRLAVVIAGLLPLIYCVVVLLPLLGTELIPEVNQGEFSIDVELPVGTQLRQTAERVRPIEAFLVADPRIQTVATVAGVEKQSTRSGNEGEHTARITSILKPTDDPVLAEQSLIRELRTRMAGVVGMNWKISRPVLFSFKAPIEIEIRGYSLQVLRQLSGRVEERLQEIPGLTDIKSFSHRGYPEVQIRYNRGLLAQHNLNIRTVATLVQNKVLGHVPTRFRQDERTIDIRVRLKDDDKRTINQLKRLTVNPNQPTPLPLEAVADITIREGPSEIRRIDQERVGLITANHTGIDLGTAIRRIEAALATVPHPPDFTFLVTGQNREMEKSLNSLMFALALAVFLIYVIMASQFESFLHPLAIMMTIPLALIGVIGGLYLFHIPISIVVFIGVIMLAGIVVNNAIVLVDYINRLRRAGQSKTAAIIEAGSVRLRPILMTTSTTVLGLLPMALALGQGAEIRTPMAITVIFGLISSTILTLIVVPTVYHLLDRNP